MNHNIQNTILLKNVKMYQAKLLIMMELVKLLFSFFYLTLVGVLFGLLLVSVSVILVVHIHLIGSVSNIVILLHCMFDSNTP